MSRKKRYPCDIFYHIFAYNFWTVSAMVMKFGTIIENHKLHIIIYILIIFMSYYFFYKLWSKRMHFFWNHPFEE